MVYELPCQKILLVEDNPADVQFFLAAVGKRLAEKTAVVTSGEAAQEYLARCIPELLVLDIGLPNMSGLEVLRWMKTQERLRNVPVVVLTIHDEGQCQRLAERLGADEYVLKEGFDSVLRIIRRLELRTLEMQAESNYGKDRRS